MDENKNYYQEDSGLQEVINRYERMLKANTSSYFDVHEFERIVDHYLDIEKYPSAIQAVDNAISQHPTSTGLLLKKAQVLAESGKPGDGLNYIYKIERIEQAQVGLGLQHATGVRLERIEHGFAADRFRPLDHLRQDGLVAHVDPIEIAHRHDRPHRRDSGRV